MSNRMEKYWIEQARKTLCKGLHAELQGRKLVITKDNKPFTNFSIGATLDWMSGNFSINGQIVYQWDRGRRKKRRKYDCWETHAETIVHVINGHSK